MQPKGGTATVRVQGIPYKGTGWASTPPRLPQPLPPYASLSLLSNSGQKPPRGTPTRTLGRGTGVKLQITNNGAPDADIRRKLNKLVSGSLGWVQAKPPGSVSRSWSAPCSR